MSTATKIPATGDRSYQQRSSCGTRITEREKGFSLIELLIVVAIILIIAAIAIPNLLRARYAANESSAVASMRVIISTSTQYYATYGTGYPATLANLRSGAGVCMASAAQACLLDMVLSSGTKSGYTFVSAGNTLVGPTNTGFEANGTPQNPGITGQRAFCADQTGVIRFNLTGAAIGIGPGSCSALPPAQVIQ
jgi:prepilin-type N-terminal cleavage/methylation domain-containing protein